MCNRNTFQCAVWLNRSVHGKLYQAVNLWKTESAILNADILSDAVCRIRILALMLFLTFRSTSFTGEIVASCLFKI